MVHVWDSEFPYLAAKEITKIDAENERKHDEENYSLYYNRHMKSMISYQKDIDDLYLQYHQKYYNECSGKSDWTNNELTQYSVCGGQTEFVAEIFSVYYLKYIVPTGNYVNISYPDDVKKTVEKYLCLAKNNYDSDICV